MLTKRAKFVAWYEILAGITGLVIVVHALFTKPPTGWDTVLAILLASLCGLSLLAGLSLYSGKPIGKKLSYLVQGAQLPVVLAASLHYRAFLLLSVSLGLDSAKEVILRWACGAGMNLALGPLPHQFLGVNLLALLMLLLLFRSVK